jgi:hypothetical protein
MCDHKWMVFSTAQDESYLMLKCETCKAFGTVDDPTDTEWSTAFHAPTNPYRWHENDRVTIRIQTH